ncbi:RHS repeat-associated core domain-containing protein [Pseudomonas helleri]|uniref:RHS repeat-associated core domain-containing protein n=1 Tax=Pseudomonas helleri TaxID=1608996 RepID=UPI0028E1D427|nr:RHS repeat-associated core domain-containing protein [Pseudomonas helleri]
MPSSLHQRTPSLTVVDPRGLVVRSIAYHRQEIEEPIAERIQRQVFNAKGHLCQQWDPRLFELSDLANQSRLYSLSGQALLTTSVDAGWRLACHDAAGQLRDSWDGRDTHRRYTYDELMRPVNVFEHEPPLCVERFTYAGADEEDTRHNRCGQLLRHDDQAGSLWHEAFALTGQPLSETRRFCTALTPPHWPASEADLEDTAYTTRWRHDALGAVIEQIDALEHVQHFEFDVAGQPFASWLDGVALLKSTTYNALGRVESEQAGNDVTTTAFYSARDGLLSNLKAKRSDGKTLQDLHYQYDPVGNITRIEDLAQPVQWFAGQRIQAVSTYTYDTLYQLISATGRENASQTIGPGLPGLEIFGSVDDSRWRTYSQTYSYDSGGNLTRLKHAAGAGNSYTREMVVDARSNRSLFKDGSPLDVAKAFDANGNLQALAPDQLMQWDSRNQLQHVTQVQREDPDGQDDDTETYVYDGGGQRVRKVRRAKTRGGAHISEVRYLPGLEIRSRTTGEQLHVVLAQAGRNAVRLLNRENGQHQYRYSVNDHLGSSTLELDQSGELLSQESYYPYGGTAWWAAKSALEARYKVIRYSGKERDATGLYYYGFRYYAPWLQRWINPDPAGDVDGLNLYRMVRNNPVRFYDGDGRQPKEIDDDYSENSPSARFEGHEQDLQTFRRRDLDEQAAVARQEAVASSLSHQVYGTHTMGSVYTDSSIPERFRFKNEYLPGRWKMMENFRAPIDGPNATDVTWHQYEQISRQNNFYGVLPQVIVRWDVINNEALGATNKQEGMLVNFLKSAGNGRSTQRIMDAFGLQATAIERREVRDAFKGVDIDIIAVHVVPDPAVQLHIQETLRIEKEIRRDLKRASRHPVSRAAHSAWRAVKRVMLPNASRRALR